MIMMDYVHQDVYMNKKLFKQIIHNSNPIEGDLNPLQFSSLVPLNITHKPHDNLTCL